MKPLDLVKKQYMWSFFKEKVLPELTNKKSTLKLKEFKLQRDMTDSKIQKEFSNIPILVEIFASVLQEVLQDKSKWYLFHVQLKDRVVAVGVDWNDDEWDLRAFNLDYVSAWSDSNSFFTPATGNSDSLTFLKLEVEELKI